MAEAADTDFSWVVRIESGAVNPSVVKLVAIADALGVPPALLLRPRKLRRRRAGRPKRAGKHFRGLRAFGPASNWTVEQGRR